MKSFRLLVLPLVWLLLCRLAADETRLSNLAIRAQGGGGDTLRTGFTISAGPDMTVLIRAVGPTLSDFGVPGTLVDPKLELFSGETKLAENDNWGTPIGAAGVTAAQLEGTFAASGAFPLANASRDAALVLHLAPGSYSLKVSGVGNTTGAALVEVYDLTPPPSGTALYVAQIRPESAAAGSTASGYATILLSEDGKSASVSLFFSNLAGAQTAGYLKIGDNLVFPLGLGQVAGRFWTFSPTANFSTAQLIDALQTGRLSVALDSARFPSGEARGTFIVARGSETFTAPAAPPALSANALTAPTTQTDAARLLTQATYGPTIATINALMSRGVTGWIDDQMALPATSALAELRADVANYPPPPQPAVFGAAQRFAWNANMNAVWWKIAATSPDQLRQRVAFALSEIFVVGVGTDLDFHTESRASLL
jgi:hypothetical protein